LCALAAAFIGGSAWQQWRDERREFDQQIDGYEQRLVANRAGRHRASQPRAELPPVTPPPVPDRSGYRDTLRGHYAALHAGHVAAEHIDSVLLAPAPAPDLNGAADTGTLPSLAGLTDTGAFAAITEWGDRMSAAIETGTL
jgi:hypothetical protein